jgi:two-component system response regulator DctR
MSEPAAHVVDDDEAIRDALTWLLRSRGVAARTFDSGESFLAAFSDAMRGCVVLDVRMDGMSGVEVHDQLLARGCRMPVLFLTGHGDVPLAVAALKKGAFDFAEKPFNDNQLVNRVIEAMALDEARRQQRAAEEGLSARLAQLTPREREVMDQVAAGKQNKEIAEALQVAVRTVEVHRARVFQKMGVKSAVELALLLGRRG